MHNVAPSLAKADMINTSRAVRFAPALAFPLLGRLHHCAPHSYSMYWIVGLETIIRDGTVPCTCARMHDPCFRFQGLQGDPPRYRHNKTAPRCSAVASRLHRCSAFRYLDFCQETIQMLLQDPQTSTPKRTWRKQWARTLQRPLSPPSSYTELSSSKKETF